MKGSNPSRVLFCIGSHNLWGGIEHWLDELSGFLSSRDWDIRVGLARGSRFNLPREFQRMHPRLNAVELDGRTGTPVGRMRAVLRAIAKVGPDVLIPVGLADGFRAAEHAKRTGNPIRVLAPLRATSPELLGEIEAFAPIIDLCVGNNPLHAKFLRESGRLPKDRVTTIMNGVRLPAAERMTTRKVDSPLRLLFVGRLHPGHKRVLDLPLLLNSLDRRGTGFQMTVVGDGEGKKALLGQMHGRMESGEVRFLGFMTPESIAREVFPEHDVLVHFSAAYGEGCPQVLQQAMANGVVPVCSEFIGIHSLGFLRDWETCCSFPTGEIESAASKIATLAHDPALLARMAKSGRDCMRQFPMERALVDWEDAINRVMQLPVRGLGDGSGMATPRVAPNRLERLGLRPEAADRIRRLLRRYPSFIDGWAEWPGTVTVLEPARRSAMLAELARLDLEARQPR